MYNDPSLTWVVVGGGVLAVALALTFMDLRMLRDAWVVKTAMIRAQNEASLIAARTMALTNGMGGAAALGGVPSQDLVDYKPATWEEGSHVFGE